MGEPGPRAGKGPDGVDGSAASQRRAAQAHPDRRREALRVHGLCPGPYGAGGVWNCAICQDAHGVGALLCGARPIRAVDIRLMAAGGPGACHGSREPTAERGRSGDPGGSRGRSGGAPRSRNRGRQGAHVAVPALPAGAASRVPHPSRRGRPSMVDREGARRRSTWHLLRHSKSERGGTPRGQRQTHPARAAIHAPARAHRDGALHAEGAAR